jgi:hypothetical protein
MLHTCKLCGDYFEGEWMKYCPTEGGELTAIDANDPGWSDAFDVVQKKAKLKRRKQLRVKLSRMFVVVTTLLITVIVVCVVVVNGVIYFGDRRVAAPSPSPSPSTSPVSCSEDDISRESHLVRDKVMQIIEADLERIAGENGPPAPEMSLSPVTYEKWVIEKNCAPSAVTVKYEWQIKRPGEEAVVTSENRHCVKTDGPWICD